MPSAQASSFAATTRLARRVLDGEVVFFVGSGFSADSERNTASRLVGRLLAGLLAMGTVLAERPRDEPPDAEHNPLPEAASKLLDGLGRVFGLAGAERAGDAARRPARCMVASNLERLAREYYSFNDWSVSALGTLTDALVQLDPLRQVELSARMLKLGNYLLTLVGDTEPLDAIDPVALGGFECSTARGKAAFLDLMGFANPAIMGGTPRETDEVLLAQSYGARIRPRHVALARLAREGLAPTLVTTNYDLLLEGAYRLAGFVEREHGAANRDAAEDSVARYSRITGADQFFSRGTGYRTALLLKIHGCALSYREARFERLKMLQQCAANALKDTTALDVWAAYLPAMVFTYREIQTWRNDAWSRDLIRTLLRTHTIALCGYSAADPVMHATFREVYEEKALARAVLPPLDPASQAPPAGPENASVFFFGFAERREFHSLEILRAATAAAGLARAELVEHPNHIEFEPSSGFPALDDHFRWLSHCVLRDLQRQALQSRLPRMMYRLLSHACRHREVERVRESFAELCTQERRDAEAVARLQPKQVPSLERSRRFDAIVGWTWHFVPGFLRELALAAQVDESREAGRGIQRRRTTTYYHPASENPEWAAWAVVLELALRQLVACLPRPTDSSRLVLHAAESPHAAISFSRGEEHQPFALCVRLGGYERPGRAPSLTGAFRRVSYWELSEKDIPWPRTSVGGCPSPGRLWNWAMGEQLPDPTEAACLLGVS